MIKIPKNNRSQYQKYLRLMLGMLIIMVGNIKAAEEENTKKPIILKAHDGSTNAVAYSPNGIFFASASTDGTIKLWYRFSLKCFGILEGGGFRIQSLSFNHDGQYLISVFTNITKVWDMNTLECINTFENYFAAAFYPQKNSIIITCFNGTKSYNFDTKKYENLNVNDILKSIIFNHNGKYFAYITFGGSTNKVHLRNTLTGELIKTINYHDTVSTIAFHPHENIIAIGFINKKIKILKLKTNDLLHDLTIIDSVRALTFSPNGTFLASNSDRSIKLWNADTGEWLRNIEQPSWVDAIAFSPDGETIIAGLDNGSIAVINIYDYISRFQFVD